MSGGLPGSRSSPYRLSELGWLQFDRLSALVLEAETGAGDLHWRGHSDDWRGTTVEHGLTLGDPRAALIGPVDVVVFWVPDDAPSWVTIPSLSERFTQLIDAYEESLAAELIVFTNLETAQAAAALRGLADEHGRQLVLLGASEIGRSVDRHAGLRLALPSLLGLRGIGPLTDRGGGDRSSLDIGRAQELSRVFWPTRAYARALAVLGQHQFVVLTGPPEMGKTAIAQMLSLAQMTAGWEAFECTDPNQVWRVFDRDRRQVFVADDAFGSTEYRPDSAERWALGLGRLLGMLDENHWLIWTSRPAPLKAGLRRVQRERGSGRFPSPGAVLVDASDLDLEEKTLILFRHAKAKGVSDQARSLLRTAGIAIVEHPYFTPERIRRFVSDRVEGLTGLSAASAQVLLEQELASPTEAMRNSFTALTAEHRALLIAMLDASAGVVDEREFAATVRRHHPGGLTHSPSELIDRLTDHFLRVTPLGIGWVHPSWRDLVIDELGVDAVARQRFLGACGVEGVVLALSVDGGGAGERVLPLLETDADWDQLANRIHALLRELEPRDVARLLLGLEAAQGELDQLRQGLELRQVTELRSLAAQVLETTRSAWDDAHQALPAFLLEAWYRLRSSVPGDATHPQLATTWAELHPGTKLLDHPNHEELSRADEWLALAQILHEHDPSALRTLGFFDRDPWLLLELTIVLIGVTSPETDVVALAASVLLRIEALTPLLADDVRYAMGRTEMIKRPPQAERWWVPSDIAAPPSSECVAERAEFTRRDVDRVLEDL